MTQRKFDRVPSRDPRNRLHPVSLLWTVEYEGARIEEEPPIVTQYWEDYAYLDQGPDGACVGFGFSGELASTPEVVNGITNATAKALYLAAQKVDEWPGESYEGTSVLAGAKVVQSQGYYTGYYWAFDEHDVAITVSNYGPVVIGVNWYSGMMDPDSNGYLHPTGSVVGGHCVVVIGINVEKGYYVIRNSWGSSWGDNGEAKLIRSDMARLMSEQGDVCKPVRVHTDPDPDPVDPEPINPEPVNPEPINPEPIPPKPNKKCDFWCKLKCYLLTGRWRKC